MATNVWLHTNKVTSSITITPDSEATLYPKANLYDLNHASVFRTQNASSAHNIVFDFGSATTIDTVALANINLTTASTVSIQGNAADAWGAPTFNEAINMTGLSNTPPYANLFHKLSTQQNFRYFRLLITDTANPAGYYELGEVWMGNRVAATHDFEITWQQTYPDANAIHTTEWGHDYAYIRDMGDYRTFEVEWRAVPLSMINIIRTLKRAIKTSGYPFWLCPLSATAPLEGFFVRMIGDLQVTQQSATAYSARAMFKELPRGQTLPT